jgi:type I restriction-modification system DNA methylase subunit
VIALIAEIIASKIEESDKLLTIYDCTCGGGNMLFGVEDRINEKFERFTQTYGQDWNDSLYALAKIESRFRVGSQIEHGNTLVNDKYYNDTFLRLYFDKFGGIKILVPPFVEQKAIAEYLDTKTTHIDRIIETINIQVEKLKELRKTLINDVVTGKIKITQELNS